MKNECPKCQTENTSDSHFCKKCATPLPYDVEITESFTKTSETPTEELTTGSTFAKRYQIIKELGVNFVLWGTVRWNMNPRGKGRVLVTPELIRVSDEIIIWSDRYRSGDRGYLVCSV